MESEQDGTSICCGGGGSTQKQYYLLLCSRDQVEARLCLFLLVEYTSYFSKAVIRGLLVFVCLLLRSGLTVLSKWSELTIDHVCCYCMSSETFGRNGVAVIFTYILQ